MFWKFLRESLWRPGSRHHALWAVLAVALGTTIAAAMLNVSLDIGDKVGNELRSLGANITITPAADSLPVEIGGIDFRPVSEGSFIPESTLPKLKQIFWRNNIVAFAPFVNIPVTVHRADGGNVSVGLVGTWFDHNFTTSNHEGFTTGIKKLNPTWKAEGEWIEDSDTAEVGTVCMVGQKLSGSQNIRPGDVISIGFHAPSGSASEIACTVRGVLITGGEEDSQVFTTLSLAQSLAGLGGEVRKVQVSALTKPEDERSRRDPKTMTPAEYDRWYCSPYISSIVHQIGEVLPGATARQIQPVAETQGKVLSKLTFFMGLLALLALAAAAMSVSSVASLTVLKRRQEISLMKAIGAQDRLVAALFLAEAALQGLLGGVLGFGGGLLLAKILERVVFSSSLVINWMLLPLTLLVGISVSFLGAWGPLKIAMDYEPASVLRGE